VTEHQSRDFEDIPEPWYNYSFDDEVGFWETSYDRKFCQLLRAGIEDAQAVLLLALLPNIQVIVLRGGPYDFDSLEWRAGHQFTMMRELTVCGPVGDLTWPIGFYNPLFAKAFKLETSKQA
jgi:hypothetical protein